MWIAILGFWLLFVGQINNPAQKAVALQKAGVQQVQQYVNELAHKGIVLDLEKKRITLQAEVLETEMPIEYLLVAHGGATHEAVFVTAVQPSELTTAVYLLGLNPGKNVIYQEKNPPPSMEEIAGGVAPYEIIPPQGDGVYFYASWREQSEAKRYRVEDLLLNIKRNHVCTRQPWIFLGSRLVRPTPQREEVFAADLEFNIASVTYFTSGNQIFAYPELDAAEQHIFYPNHWLLPAKGTAVNIILTLEPL